MKAKILIVEDEADLRELVRLVLENERYEISEVADLAGLRLCLAGAAATVVLLDLRLPDGESLAVLPELKQKWPGARVILLTGNITEDLAESAHASDPTLSLLCKPFDPGTLQMMVEKAVLAATAPETALMLPLGVAAAALRPPSGPDAASARV